MRRIPDHFMKPGSIIGPGFLLFLAHMSTFLCGCTGSDLSYTPAEISNFRKIPGSIELEFSTSKGRQAAFYVGPRRPETLVVMFPGIGSRALDRLDWVRASQQSALGWLLIDYPGRGKCEGSMRPKLLPQTNDGAVETLRKYVKAPESFSVVGHSFGTAAALQFCQGRKIDRVVLLAPFTTLRRAMFRTIGPLAWIVPENLDSMTMLKSLVSREAPPKITIIHGTADETIPIGMGRELHAVAPNQIEFVEVEGGDHTSILRSEQGLVLSRVAAILGKQEGIGIGRSGK